MNADILRKAVELADGWFDNGNGTGFCPFIPERVVNYQNMGGFADLLAAQLVRQIDERDDDTFLETEFCFVRILNAKDEIVARASGPDRTENTIMAIVESGILG